MNDWAHQTPGQGSQPADAMGQGREGATAGPGSQAGAALGQQVGDQGYRGPGPAQGQVHPRQAGGQAASGMYGAGTQMPGHEAYGSFPSAPRGGQGGSEGYGQPGGGVPPGAYPGGVYGGMGPGYQHQPAAYYGYPAQPYPPFQGQYHPAMGYPPMQPPYPPHGYPPQAAPAAERGGMSDLMEEIANGGNGLSSLTKMLSLDDSEFWKGALVGAAAVLLLTNESVQGALFKAGARTSEAVKSGIDRVKGKKSEGPADE